MAISVWAMVLLPGCGTELNENNETTYLLLPLDSTQKNNLESLVNTIIPKTETLGAVELEVQDFIDRLLANCYEESFQNDFIKGLDKLENTAQSSHHKSFFNCEKVERENLLLTMDNEEMPEEKQFFDLSKELTILGYTTSEYFLTNFTNYQMVPGDYDGCLPVPNEPFKI